MYRLYLSNTELIDLANNTTLGKESNALERTPTPKSKPLVWSVILAVIAILLAETQDADSIAGIILSIAVIVGGYWACKRIAYQRKLNRYKWITWLFTGIGMVFRGELQEAEEHYAHGTGNRNENIRSLKQTCIEMILQKIGPCNQPCGINNNIWALNSIISLNDVLCAFGDNSFSEQASKSLQLLSLFCEYGVNGNRMADSSHYGQARSTFSYSGGSSSEGAILNSICSLEEQCRKTVNDPLMITEIDAEGILDVLYSAAYANPPISSDTYSRIQGLSLIAYGTAYDMLNPDAMLAHLIRCKQLSIDRANREINETRKWVEKFIKTHSGNSDFDTDSFVYSFCGALKLLQLYDLEKACLETAEKNIGILNADLTARLDYLSRGGGQRNAKVLYYSGQKRSDTLPVDYDAAKMNTSDIEWLFNEVLGVRGKNAFIDYGLAYRVQNKKVCLPSAFVKIQGKSIAGEIQAKLGAGTKVSKVMVTALNSNETLQCLKIRTDKFPFMAFLLDMIIDNLEIRIRLAACWIPISNILYEQKQQCLSLWNKGASEEMHYMDSILSAIENDIQRSIDKWNTSQSQNKPPLKGKPDQPQEYY